MPKESIQTDETTVEEEEGGKTEIIKDEKLPPESEEKTEREDIMERVAKRRQEQIEEEMKSLPEESPEPEPIESPPADESAAEEPGEEGPPPGETVAVKIDGTEQEIPKEDFDKQLREYQKHGAADKRLQEAAEIERRAREREAAIEAREKALEEREAAPVIEAEDPDAEAKVLADELSSAIFQEDTEAIAAVIDKIRRGASAAPPAIDVGAEVDRRLREKEEKRRELDVNSAVARFQEDYKELSEDPLLRAAVDEQTIIEQRADPKASPWTIIERSAKVVRERFLAPTRGEAPKEETVVDSPTRRQRKQSAGPPVRAATSTAALKATTKDEPKLTPVQEILKARGQL